MKYAILKQFTLSILNKTKYNFINSSWARFRQTIIIYFAFYKVNNLCRFWSKNLKIFAPKCTCFTESYGKLFQSSSSNIMICRPLMNATWKEIRKVCKAIHCAKSWPHTLMWIIYVYLCSIAFFNYKTKQRAKWMSLQVITTDKLILKKVKVAKHNKN